MTPEFQTVGEIAAVDSGPAFKSAHFGGPDEGIRLLRGDNIEPGALRWAGTRTWPESMLPGYEHLAIKEGDLILGMDRPLISAGLKLARARPSDLPALLVQRVARIRPHSINGAYLYHWLSGFEFQQHLNGSATGTQLPHVNLKSIKQFKVPRFSEAAEARIVEVLEDHLSRLDAGVDYLNAARRRCALYEDATIMRALGSTESRQDGVEQIINGHLPALAEGWSWQTLGEVADVVGGVTKDAKKQSDPSYIEVPYLRVANVQRARLDLENVTTLRVPPAKAEALRLLKGDVLMNEGGDRDKLARGWVWDGQIEGCIHQNHVFRVRPRDDMRSEWLAWCANTYGARWAQRHGKQSVNLASISLKVIKTMPIPVPPLPDQDERLAQIHEVVSRSRRLIGEVETGLARADRLRRSLLTAAFSGRLTGAASDVERVEEIAADVVEAEAPEGVLF
ncbi:MULTISPECIES: restriction endonuclease subunit S [Streptomyces]|uniref:Restriction endonuclease subunit S n=1 Tax=Streptomyces mutomycini TaxID=284036 RepID=A0ABW0B0A1_9ACTN|nr:MULTISPECIES: restriction endonuclease subunit S [Streptomyces]